MIRRIMRKLVLALGLAIAVLPAKPARACSCLPHGSDADEAAKSDAVFEGTATRVTDTNTHSIAQIAVSKAIKGASAGAVVTVDGGSSLCGFTFERGKRYKVFATKNDRGELVTGLCTATRQL